MDRPLIFDAPPTLYGRDAEQATLRGALDAALAGRGVLALVAGEAGIGKTALVDVLSAEAQRLGALVARGYCYDLTITPPYGPWLEVLTGLASDEAPPALIGSGGNGPTPAGQDAQFAAVARFIIATAQRRPLMLVLEDQHWADFDSLQLLRAVARAVHAAPVLLVVTYRDVELSAATPLYRMLPMLVRETRPVRIALRPIGADAVRALIAARYPLSSADANLLVAHLLATAEGNPFFTEEILRTLEHNRLLAPGPHGWVVGDLAAAQVPHLVRQMIDARVARLDDETRRLLQIASVIGSEIPLDLWAALTEATDEALARVVEQAVAAQVLAESPRRGSYRFSHALVREALYESLILPRRRAWHRQIGDVLAAQPAPEPDAVAHHFQRARDPRAAAWLIQAGERASRANAIQDAVERFEQALRLLEGDDSALVQRVRLLCNLAGAYRYTDPARALVDLDRARDLADRLGDRTLVAIVRWNRARIRGFLAEDTRADIDEAIAAYHALTAEERVRVRELGRGVAGSQGALVQWLAHHGRYADALAIGEDCLRDPAPADDADREIEMGHAHLGVALSRAGLGLAREARAAFAAAHAHFDAARYHFMTAASVKWELLEEALAFRADDPAEVERLVTEYERVWLLTGHSVPMAGDHPLTPLYPPAIVAGRWDEASAAARAYVGDAYLRVDALAALAEIERYRGEHAAAWGRVRQAIPDGPETEPGTPFFVRTLALQRIAAALALDAGDLDLALDWTAAHDRWLHWSGRVLDRAWGRLLRARHAEQTGDLARAAALAHAAIALAEDPRQPLALLVARRAAGRIARLAGQHAAAAGELDIALDIADACRAPYQQALTLLEQAELALARGGRPATTLDAALATFRALAARPALERAVTLRERVADVGPIAPADLSARELEVLRLVARGMTDGEVAEHLSISRRTVAGHLQSIYTKLQVSTRTAAAAWAFEHRLVT